MKSIKKKAIEYAKTKHTNQNLIEIVSWDFEAGVNYVLEQLEEFQNFFATCITSTAREYLKNIIEQLKGNQ